MRLKVNIDAGIAIDLDKVAALIRGNVSSETKIILVSGNTFIMDKPLSVAIEIVNGLDEVDDEKSNQRIDTQDSDKKRGE